MATHESISRRNLLRGLRRTHEAVRTKTTTRQPSLNSPRLIVINERGGCDLMAKLGPYTNKNYADLRSYTRMDDPSSTGANSIHLTNAPEPFAIPQAMSGILPAWNKGAFAFVVQTGTVFPSFSHFAKQDHLELGDLPNTPCPQANGWIARYLDHRASMDPTLTSLKSPRAVAFAPSRPLALRSQLQDAQKVLSAVDPYTLMFPGPAMAPFASDYETTVQGLHGTSTNGLAEIAQSLFDGFDYVEALENQLGPTGYTPSPGVSYGADPIGQRLQTIAAMCSESVTGHCPEVFHLDIGGFDTHSDEDLFTLNSGTLGSTLKLLCDALGAFHEDMRQRQIDYVVVTVSEFGRRAGESDSNGTDHGDGGVMMLMGPEVDGGKIHGQWGSLDDIVLGNLPTTTDVRNVLGEVLERYALLSPADLDIVFPSCAPSPFVYSPIGVMK